MPEVHQPLIPIQVDYLCDSCGKGRLVRPNAKLESIGSAAGLQHVCPLCNTEYFLPRIYPYISYVNFYDFLNDARAAIATHKANRQ